MSGITQQLPALIGVVIGALASYLAGAATERARWRRQESSRWDDRRAQAYADYGRVTKSVYVQCQRAASLRDTVGLIDPGSLGQALAELGQLTDERTTTWESVLLLGTPTTIAAARAWHRRIWQVELFARGMRTDLDQWDPLNEQVIQDRARFYAAARHDLGIKSGDVPPGDPWDADTPVPELPVTPLTPSGALADVSSDAGIPGELTLRR